MKHLFLICLLFVSAIGFAANPTFQQFDLGYFSTNSQLLSIQHGRFSGDFGGPMQGINSPVLALRSTNYSSSFVNADGRTMLHGDVADTNAVYLTPSGFYVIANQRGAGKTNEMMGLITHRSSQDVDVGRYCQDLYLFTQPGHVLHLASDPNQLNSAEWAFGTNTFDTGPFSDGLVMFDSGTGGAVLASSADFSKVGFGSSPSACVTIAMASGNVATTGTYAGSGRGITNASALAQTNFISGAFYTNNASSLQMVRVTASLTTAAVNGGASMDLMCDPAGGHSGTLLDRHGIGTTVAVTLAQTYTNGIVGLIVPGGVFWITNTSQGAGNAAALVAGTGQLTTLP